MSSALRFDGRVAVVTGAGSGLGREHALLLASRGASLVVNDLPSTSQGEPTELSPAGAVVAELRSLGHVDVTACDADVSTESGADATIDAALQTFGRIDIVINNAGILRSVDFLAMTTDVFDHVLAVNLRSTYLVTRAAWTHFAEQHYGRVVSTTSNSGLLGTAGSTAYAASKAGVWGLTRSLALEGRSMGINVNAIAPMAFTPMSMTSRVAPPSWQSGEGDEWARRLDPVFVAPAVAWLAHHDCGVNGQVLSVAGGQVARFAMGLTEGFVDRALSVESVRDHADVLLRADAPTVELRRSADEGKHLRSRLLGP